MELIINSNDDAKDALRRAAKDAGLSLTALGDEAGIGKGTLTRYTNGHVRQRALNSPNPRKEMELWLSTFIRSLDTAGYQVVVRPKVSSSRRVQKLRVIKQRSAESVGEPRS